MSLHIAVDVGGTQLRAACYPAAGLKPLCLARTSTRPSAESPQPCAPLERLQELIASLWPNDEPVTAIGIAVPGPTNPFTGVIHKAPNIPEWNDLPLGRILADRFKVPVALGNDANLAALAEWKYGAGQGHHHMLYLTISTGIGSGIIVNDQLLLGANGLAAELGHITVMPDGPLCGCGFRGHLEALAAGPAIARWVQEQLAQGATSMLSSGQIVTARMVAEAARQGDALCIAALARAGRFIGYALADFLLIFNPTAVIIGGGVSQSGPLLLEPMCAALKERAFNPHYLDQFTLAVASFGDEVGLVGALALARTAYPSNINLPA